MRSVLLWAMLAAAILIPIGLAAASPLLQWRGPIYVAAGFAGIVGLALMLFQPLLASGALPGAGREIGRRVHRILGVGLVLAVLVHIGGLWITSPPDVIDVLLLRSPTPFAIWGVAGMWAVLLAAAWALIRKRLRVRPSTWRKVHSALTLVAVLGTIIHALLIEGAMETFSKIALTLLVATATLKAIWDLRIWKWRA